MDRPKNVPVANRRIETQIQAAVRIAHLLSAEPTKKQIDLATLLAASRQLETNEEMREAMVLAACAAQKNLHPV